MHPDTLPTEISEGKTCGRLTDRSRKIPAVRVAAEPGLRCCGAVVQSPMAAL